MEQQATSGTASAVLTPPAMRLRSVGVSFAGRTAVRNVSFNVDENKVTSLIGPSGSGKTTIVRKISELVSDFVFIPQDNYYKSAEYISNSNITAFNFDHPDAFDWELLNQHLALLAAGQSAPVPVYDFTIHDRSDRVRIVHPAGIVVVEEFYS